MANESAVLKEVKKLLNSTPKCVGLRITNTSGVPDLIACVNGTFIGIEVKDDVHGSYTLTKAQKMRLRHIIEAGGIACVVDKNNVGAFGCFLMSRNGVSNNRGIKCWGIPENKLNEE